jgi:hypothetical protein
MTRDEERPMSIIAPAMSTAIANQPHFFEYSTMSSPFTASTPTTILPINLTMATTKKNAPKGCERHFRGDTSVRTWAIIVTTVLRQVEAARYGKYPLRSFRI